MTVDKDKSADFVDLLNTGGAWQMAAEARDEVLGGQNALIGRELAGYELFAHIADGGMSRVYRARRADGRFDRDVAVKVSPASLLDERLRDRFFQEQQILASLNHPSIAQLYDAGIADEGWPYIVMELVAGTPIDQFCAKLETRARLELMIKICAALSFAHARLVVHRDIKPGNVLVTHDGEPKLLDFGIAKLLTNSPAATQMPSLTPRYASPEQLLGQAASVASDVYQVGLLLAEILHPDLLDRPNSLMDAMQRATGNADRVLNREISRTLPKELISIIEQCVRAAPEERYASISAVQQDITNYLSGFPVSATGNSRSYRSRKFLRRNAAALSTSAVVVVAFVLSGAWYVTEVSAARDRAELEAATAQEVADFMAGLFRSTAPSRMRGEDLTASQLLERGLDRLDEELGDQPLVHAQLQAVLGDVHRDLGEYDTAEALLNEAMTVQSRELGEGHPRTIETLQSLAGVASGQGLYDESERLRRQAIALSTVAHGADHPETLKARRRLASDLRLQGDFATAAALQKELVEIYRASGEIATASGIAALSGLAIATIQSGKPQEAQRYFEEALALSREHLGPRDLQTIGAINSMATMLRETGRPEAALTFSREAYEQTRAVFGENHHSTVSAAANHANGLRQLDRMDEAREYAEFAYTTAINELPRSHMATNRAITEMGFVEMYSHNYVEAEALFFELVEIEKEFLGERHMYTIGTMLKAAAAIAFQGRIDDAVPIVEESIQLLLDTQGPDHQETLFAEKQLAGLHIMSGRFDDAKPILKRVIDGLAIHLGEDARQVQEAEGMLADAIAERVVKPGDTPGDSS